MIFMKKYLHHALISLKPETYLSLIIFLAPFANFLGGVTVDIYSPSMPAIAAYFHATIIATKNTITLTMFGWAIGGIFFGILIDSIGRKKVLVYGVLFYVLSSFAALFCQSIHELMVIRFIQGFSVASISTGCRVLLVDVLSGRRFAIAVLYTSIGYGVGPIVGPFMGGFLQHYFGWKANFVALAVLSTSILLLLFLFVKESIPVRHPLKLGHIFKRCFSVVSHKKFMAGVMIGGIGQIQMMLYPTLGPFIVEKILHQTVLVYGNSALIIGGSYLMGAFFSRALLKYMPPKPICDMGFIVLIIGLAMSFLFAKIGDIDLTTVMLPLLVTCVSTGMISPNVLGHNIKQFSHSAGIAMAIQVSSLMVVASVGIFFVSHVHVVSLFELSDILLPLAIFEIIIFYGFYRKFFLEA